MNANAIQACLFVIAVALLVKPVGAYLERVFVQRRTLLDPLLLPLERLIHRLMGSDLAANTAVSFATTTTWQAYAGETTMSYLSQLLLAGQTFWPAQQVSRSAWLSFAVARAKKPRDLATSGSI
jgi:K+-transporting ATPase ATPase A chain